MAEKSILDLASEFHAECREAAKAASEPSSLVSFRPMASEALAVHPDQVPEAREDAKRRGVPVEFQPTGEPVFTSSRQFREYAKAYGYRHRGYT